MTSSQRRSKPGTTEMHDRGLSGKKVFVTGGSSPVGRLVLRSLLNESAEITCLFHRPAAETLLRQEGVSRLIQGSTQNPERWQHVISDADVVVSLAPIALSRPLIAAAMRAKTGRYIALSSTRSVSRIPDPSVAGVGEAEAALENSPLNYTILRSTMMYGALEDANVHRIALLLERQPWIPLIDGGAARVQPVHVADVADAVLRAISGRPECERQALTLAGPEAMSWKAMVETIADVRGRNVRWIPVPYPVASGTAGLLAKLLRRWGTLPNIIARMREDRTFDIRESSIRLGGWRPRPFREGLERSYADIVSLGRNIEKG